MNTYFALNRLFFINFLYYFFRFFDFPIVFWNEYTILLNYNREIPGFLWLEKRFKIVLYSYSVLFTKKKLEMEKNVHS